MIIISCIIGFLLGNLFFAMLFSGGAFIINLIDFIKHGYDESDDEETFL